MSEKADVFKSWMKRIILAAGAYLCVISVGQLVSLHENVNVYWGGRYFGYNVWSIVLFVVTIWLDVRFLKRKNRKQAVFCGIAGLLLSIALVYGAYAHYANDIFRSVGETFQQFVMIFFLSFFTIPLMSELFVLVDKAGAWYEKQEKLVPQSPKPIKFFLVEWIIIFASYVPLFLAEWPGNFVFDAKYQIQNVIEGYYNTHHPLIHTLMMGKAYEFGQRLGNVSAGYQFYTLFQMLILSSAFAYFQLYLYKRRVPKCIRICTLIWFTVFPMHALFAISATKDVLCAAFFLYFMIYLIRFLFDKEAFSPYAYAGMIISGILLSLFRNNSFYAVMATGIILLLLGKGWKRKVVTALIFIAIFAGTELTNAGLIRYTNASTQDNYRESMSVPLQCLARICAYRADEVPEDMYEEICTYIRPIDIPDYNPYLSDSVKNHANEEKLRENTVNFLKLWVKGGLLFPGEYIESIVTNTFGYWYPANQGVYVSADIALYHTIIGMGDELEKHSYFPLASSMYTKWFWTLNYHFLPIVGYLFRNAIYVWLTILYFLWSIYKGDKKKALIGVLPLLYLATCFLGPMAALRYVYSLVVCTPLLIYMVLRSSENVDIKEEK